LALVILLLQYHEMPCISLAAAGDAWLGGCETLVFKPRMLSLLLLLMLLLLLLCCCCFSAGTIGSFLFMRSCTKLHTFLSV
jgi:hypothetical protein